MANLGTLYRFRIDLSDVDRNLYEAIDLRIQMHPSESQDYLLTRVLAYVLNYEPDLRILSGLCAGDEPAIHLPGPNGGIQKWIEIGNPSAKRLHKAAKASRTVLVYTYKDPENIRRECAGEKIHRSESIEIFALEQGFLSGVGASLQKDNRWALIQNGGELVVTVGDETFMTAIAPMSLTPA